MLTELREETRPREKKSILSQISMPTVVAAVLTSVTSFLFSSKLGLTGSLIGAALAAAVSTIASQVYNAMINSSVEKIHDISKQMHTHTEARHTQVEPVRHNSTLVKNTFIVAIVAALIALLAYGIVVSFATHGQGIGPTSFQEFSQPAVEEPSETTTDQSATDATSQTDASVTQTDAAATDGTTTTTDAQMQTTTTTDTSQTTDESQTTGTDGGSTTSDSTLTETGTSDATASTSTQG